MPRPPFNKLVTPNAICTNADLGMAGICLGEEHTGSGLSSINAARV